MQWKSLVTKTAQLPTVAIKNTLFDVVQKKVSHSGLKENEGE